MAIGTRLKSGVYRIEIGPNFYFGSAVNLVARRRQHFADLKAGRHPNQRMAAAFKKYGEAVFVVVGRCARSELLELEQDLLDRFFAHPRCMNLAPVAGNCSGVKHSEESRARMSSAHKGLQVGMFHPLFGKSPSTETRLKISETLTGTTKSPTARRRHAAAMRRKSTREKISAAQRGRAQSEETKRKRSLAMSGALCHRARGCWILLPTAGRHEFNTVNELASFLEVSHGTVSRWLSGSRPWPGQGNHVWGKTKHLIGIEGGYSNEHRDSR